MTKTKNITGESENKSESPGELQWTGQPVDCCSQNLQLSWQEQEEEEEEVQQCGSLLSAIVALALPSSSLPTLPVASSSPASDSDITVE